MAKTLDTTIDGGYDLPQLKSAIDFVEAVGWSITSLAQGPSTFVLAAGGPPKPVNHASFSRLATGAVASPLTIITIKPGQSIGSVVATHLAAGLHLVSYSQVYVKGKPEPVAVFR